MEDYWKLRASLNSSTTQAAQAPNHVPTNALNQVCVFPTVLAELRNQIPSAVHVFCSRIFIRTQLVASGHKTLREVDFLRKMVS